MSSRTKQRCEWLIQHLKQQGYTLQVPLREVKYAISEHIGGDNRTINKYIHRIVDYGLMKMVNPSVMQFCNIAVNPPEKDGLVRFLVVESEGEPP